MPPNNALMALIAALGGGAGGAASGLRTVDEMQTSAQREALQQHVAEENISNARAQREIERQRASNEQLHYQDMLEQQRQQTTIAQRQLDQAIASATNVAERQRLEDKRKQLEDFQTNLDRMGISSLYPEMAFHAMGGGENNVPIDPERLKALGALIHAKSGNLGNMPLDYVPGTEQYGGLVIKNHQFNPATGSDALAGARRQNAYSRMLSQQMTTLQTAYKNAYDASAKNPTVAKLLASVNTELQQQGHDAADKAAKQHVQQAAIAAMNAIRSAFPEESSGLSADALIGNTDLTPPAGGAPSGSLNLPGAQPSGAPPLNFNPLDPLNTGKPMKGPGAAPPAPTIAPPKRPNDPLGFRP